MVEGTVGVHLERPSPGRAAEFLKLARRSRELHRPWVSVPATAAAYEAYLRQCRRRCNQCFFVCAGRELAGVVSVTEIVRGVFQSAYLGFYAFAPSVRRGHMIRGLGLVLDRAFDRLGLNRLEANVQPANRASIALIEKLGFRREGYSPKYLKIGGRWRDHERWAILAEEWRRRRRSQE